MRIRQVRPEFFSDPVVARLPPDVRLTYIGLWCVADDAGYMEWDLGHIGALLYPYEGVARRERRIHRAGDFLMAEGRVIFFPCGCALIPRLEDHQKIGGNKSFSARDKHRVHTSLDKSARNVTVGNVTERGVIGGVETRMTPTELYALRDSEDAKITKPGRTA